MDLLSLNGAPNQKQRPEGNPGLDWIWNLGLSFWVFWASGLDFDFKMENSACAWQERFALPSFKQFPIG